MQHPVYVAFYIYMNHLDPEDQRVVRRWSIRLAAVCSALALLLFTAVPVRINFPDLQASAMKHESTIGLSQLSQLLGVSGAIAAEPPGVTRCALIDLQLVIALEAHGEAQDLPAGQLAGAFFMMMTAREACAAGRVDEALAIYRGIDIPPAGPARD